MIGFKNFRQSVSGSVAVEFAIVVSLFFVVVFSVFEYSRFLWHSQAVSEVASRSARCSVAGEGNATSCATPSLVRDFAIAEASALGIDLQSNEVTTSASVMCNGYLANRVEITTEFRSVVSALVPGLAEKVISVEGCYPI